MVAFQAISWIDEDVNENSCDDDDEEDELEENIVYKISIFGRTYDGKSICCRTTFQPYFFVEIDQKWSESECSIFINALKRKLGKHGKYIAKWDIVKREKYYGFTNKTLFKFIRLIFKNKKAFDISMRTLKKPLYMSGIEKKFTMFEANIPPMLRFAHVQDVKLSGAVVIDDNKVTQVNNIEKYSKCDIEVETEWYNIKGDENNQVISPLIQASFDIETYSSDGSFPDPYKKDCAVMQVATTFQVYGSDQMNKVVHVVGECDDIGGVKVVCCKTEKDLLNSWATMINTEDVDVLIGYNIWKFDLYYMYVRAQKVNASKFFNVSKLVHYKSSIREASFSSSAYGDNHYHMIDTPGIFQLDLLVIMQREHKLTSYKLDDVAFHFLKDKKVDMPYKQMFKKLVGSKQDIKEVAIYCVKDTELPQKLVNKLAIIPNMIEMAKATWVPLKFLVERGQGIKVFSQLVYKTRKRNMLVVTLEKMSPQSMYEEDYKDENNIRFISKEERKELTEKWEKLPVDEKGKYQIPAPYIEHYKSKHKLDYVNRETRIKLYEAWKIEENKEDFVNDYEGATVLKAQKGAYMDDPITGLDFASLYPTIMRAHNLDHNTFVNDPKYDNIPGIDYVLVDGHKFVQNYEGVIPEMLKDLATNRKTAKKEMAHADERGDKFAKSVANGKQLAFKVSMNSMYGFCGAGEIGMLPCKPAAACCTSIGRNMIEHTKNKVEEWYPGSEVVYGDTDSVMVKFNLDGAKGADAIKKSFELGIEAADRISDTFKKPIELEFEKVYHPYLLFSKKRYAGLMYTKPEAPDYIDAKGIQLVRRDNTPFVKGVSQTVLDMIMYKQDIFGAMEHVKEKAKVLLSGSVPISELVVSKSMKDNYKNRNQPHLVVSEKIKQREPGSEPKSGDRVPYVFIETGNSKHKQFEKAEDPGYAKEHNLKLDVEYYLHHGLASPVESLFELFLNNPSKELFEEVLDEYKNKLNSERYLHTFF